MVARDASSLQSQNRTKENGKEIVTDPKELLCELGLNAADLDLSDDACRSFRLRVPRAYINRMQTGDPADPLLRQVMPSASEMQDPAGFVYDAVGDLASADTRGVLHKYQGRALLITTGACAIHCRYCFRRHFPYSEHNAGRRGWKPALKRLRADPSVTEIILSGGDPLSLSDRRLSNLVESLDDIPHLETLRIHTRLPVVQPDRVNDALLDWLASTRLHTVLVIHANHANELDTAVATALTRIRASDTLLLNQTVLLRGVNDNPAALENLSRRLFHIGVLPYYLHLPDPVSGTTHFYVDKHTAVRIMEKLGGRLPGYLMPRLAREEAGKAGKTLIGWTPDPIIGEGEKQ